MNLRPLDPQSSAIPNFATPGYFVGPLNEPLIYYHRIKQNARGKLKKDGEYEREDKKRLPAGGPEGSPEERRKSNFVTVGGNARRGAVNAVSPEQLQRLKRGGEIMHREPYPPGRQVLETVAHSRVMKSLLA